MVPNSDIHFVINWLGDSVNEVDEWLCLNHFEQGIEQKVARGQGDDPVPNPGFAFNSNDLRIGILNNRSVDKAPSWNDLLVVARGIWGFMEASRGRPGYVEMAFAIVKQGIGPVGACIFKKDNRRVQQSGNQTVASLPWSSGAVQAAESGLTTS